jgi:3-oxo-5alpha-steroid 4-dehydrogenase
MHVRRIRVSIRPLAQELGLAVEDPLVLDDPDAHPWDEEADLVVVGLGGAGLAASIEGLERGLSVVAVDRYACGGSTAANGGIFYAGGGTAIQKAAGEEDDPEEMLKYLRIEAGNVVKDSTLRRFVEESPGTIDWILKHGGKLNPAIWRKKASYPPLDCFLYHPDNSLVASYAKRAKPAARGHRAHIKNGKKAWGIGVGITGPMTDSALRLGLRYRRHSEARQLVRDASGRVVGIKVLAIPEGSAEAKRFDHYVQRANTFLAMLPPTIPGSGVTIGIGERYLRKAMALEAHGRQARFIRAREGVLLSAGGFIMNHKMVAKYAPTYAKGMPNGTLGDQGSGIVLGMSAGGSTALMGKISAWRFINPPKAWSDAIVVNRHGRRFVDETVYGATLGEHIGDREGAAWVIYDAKLRKQAYRQAMDPKIVPFQRDVTLLNLTFNSKKAATLEGLAKQVGIDPRGLAETVAAYNAAARGEQPDPFEKEPADMQPIDTGPFYAMDISIESKLFPLAVITFGGLRVDEESGQVLDEKGKPIAGLYAAGRTAVGVASQTYVSGLSFADCFFSGRRAARSVARANA